MKCLRLTIFIALMSLSVAPTQACRLHTIWRYPWPQRCSGITFHRQPERLETPERIAPKPERIAIPEPPITRCDEFCVGWPSAEFVPCPEGDERLRGIALLREKSE
jgi:hypothetical protein